jgi:hypothetical protein
VATLIKPDLTDAAVPYARLTKEQELVPTGAKESDLARFILSN